MSAVDVKTYLAIACYELLEPRYKRGYSSSFSVT